MWQREDYQGNIVKWYEAELIEKIRKIVQEQTNTRMLFADLKSYKAFCDIERLIQENERCMHQ